MLITYTLSREQADALFSGNAVLMGSTNAIFDYRIAELFGEDVCIWAIKCMGCDGFLDPQKDWSMWGDDGCNYFRRSGFEKIVSHHNYLVGMKQYRESEGGKFWDTLWQARRERWAADEAEEERKREERRAKRPARKAQKEAKEATTHERS